MRLGTILRGLVAVAVVATGSLLVTAQPAAAAIEFEGPIFSVNTVYAGTWRAMAVLNASTNDSAQVIQHSYTTGAPRNDDMALEVEPGNFVRIKPLHTFSKNDNNPHNDKCLAILNNEPGYNQLIVNAKCTYDSVNNDVWRLDRFFDPDLGLEVRQFRSLAYNTCIVVQNASTANNARLITHSCAGGTNHYWVW